MTTAAPPPSHPAFVRALGPREALSLVVGRIIGSGIFRTPGPIMALALAPGPFFAVWLIAGGMTMLSALCYAELVAMLPRSGGPYAYLKEAYPPWWAFLRGWAMFFVSETASIAAVAIVFAQYAAVMWTASGGAAWPRGAETSLAVAGVWLFTWINARGVQAGGHVQNVLTVLKLGGLVAVAGAGLLIARGAGLAAGEAADAAAAAGATAATSPAGFWATVVAIGAALRYAFFAFSGWEGATYVAEEVREPEKNLPRSILWGIATVLGIYLLVNLAYLRQLGPAGMAGSKQVAADAMRAALGGGGAILIAVAVVLSTAGNINAQVMVKARTWHAMARDGLFPAPLGRVDARRHTPVGALAGQALWATVLLVAAGLADRAYETVIDYFAFTSALFNLSTFVAVWVLRRKLPLAARPFRVPGWPATLVVVLVIQVAFMVVTLVTAPLPSLLGMALTASGLVWYRWFRPERPCAPPPSVTGQ
ncbi:amino acid permease [bacterium]|nr:amino acid permease [bacterium]